MARGGWSAGALAITLLAGGWGCGEVWPSPSPSPSSSPSSSPPVRAIRRPRIVAPRRARPAARPRAVFPAPGLRLLRVPRFPASVYAPPRPPGGPSPAPQPVLVLLHGSYNARDEECRQWKRAGADRFGWLYCPAGVRRKDAPRGEERWTYSSVSRALREIRAALGELRRRHPQQVAARGHTLVGFSLGALLAPEIAEEARGLFDSLVLVEGVKRFRRRMARRLKRRGVRRVAYLCGETSRIRCPQDAKRRGWFLQRVGVQSRLFMMAGTGHDYPMRFAPLARQVLAWVRGQGRRR